MNLPNLTVTGFSIIILDDDIFLSSKVAAGLKASGKNVVLVRSLDALCHETIDKEPSLIIMNFGSPKLGNVENIQEVRKKFNCKLLCYLSHTKIPPVKKAVIEAGASRIVANSAITTRPSQIVDRLLADQAADPEDEQ